MKQITITLFLFATLAMAQTGSTSPKSAAGTRSAAAIIAVRDAYIAAYNAKQADKVAALYSTEAVLMTPDGTFSGRDAIRAYIQKGYDQGQSDLAVVSTKSGGDAAVQWDAGDFTQKMKGQEMKGRYLVTLRMSVGKWLIVAHADVPSMPPQQSR
jgi:uncharacterized protein (TIGR02246 family)